MNTHPVIYLSLYISPEFIYSCPLLRMDRIPIAVFEPSEELYQGVKQYMFVECEMAHKVCVEGQGTGSQGTFVTLSVTLNNVEILLSKSLIGLGWIGLPTPHHAPRHLAVTEGILSVTVGSRVLLASRGWTPAMLPGTLLQSPGQPPEHRISCPQSVSSVKVEKPNNK